MRSPLLSLPAGLNHTTSPLGLLAAAMVATAAPGAAQVRVEFTPVAAYYVPTETLFPAGTAQQFFSGVVNVKQNRGIALGGRITTWLTGRWAAAASVGYSGSGGTKLWYPFCPLNSACPGTAVALSTTGYVWMTSLRVVYSPIPRRSSASFYLLGGPAYVVHGGYDDFGDPYSGLVGTTATSAGAVLGVGAGFKVPRTAVALRADLEDYLYVARFSAQFSGYYGVRSWSTSQFQNDLLFSLGLSILPGSALGR